MVPQLHDFHLAFLLVLCMALARSLTASASRNAEPRPVVMYNRNLKLHNPMYKDHGLTTAGNHQRREPICAVASRSDSHANSSEPRTNRPILIACAAGTRSLMSLTGRVDRNGWVRGDSLVLSGF